MIKYVVIFLLVWFIIWIIWDAYRNPKLSIRQRKVKAIPPEHISWKEAARQIREQRDKPNVSTPDGYTPWDLYMDLMYLNTQVENTKKGKWTK